MYVCSNYMFLMADDASVHVCVCVVHSCGRLYDTVQCLWLCVAISGSWQCGGLPVAV